MRNKIFWRLLEFCDKALEKQLEFCDKAGLKRLEFCDNMIMEVFLDYE